MTWTYGNDPGTSTAAKRRDAVRLSTGDTDTTSQQLTDEEISFYLSESSDDYLAASVAACDALAAKYSRDVNKQIGKTRIDASDRAAHYRDLSATLQHKRRQQGAEIFAGGLTLSGKETLSEDTDAVQPSFSIGMDDHPGAV